jgi:hypothetical protein
MVIPEIKRREIIRLTTKDCMAIPIFADYEGIGGGNEI